MPLEGCTPPDTTWKADEACCEWTGPGPSGSADCPGDDTQPSLGFVAATGLCENTAYWAAHPAGTFVATSECYDTIQSPGFFSTLCALAFPGTFGFTDGCQCLDNFSNPIGCPGAADF